LVDVSHQPQRIMNIQTGKVDDCERAVRRRFARADPEPNQVIHHAGRQRGLPGRPHRGFVIGRRGMRGLSRGYPDDIGVLELTTKNVNPVTRVKKIPPAYLACVPERGEDLEYKTMR